MDSLSERRSAELASRNALASREYNPSLVTYEVAHRAMRRVTQAGNHEFSTAWLAFDDSDGTRAVAIWDDGMTAWTPFAFSELVESTPPPRKKKRKSCKSQDSSAEGEPEPSGEGKVTVQMKRGGRARTVVEKRAKDRIPWHVGVRVKRKGWKTEKLLLSVSGRTAQTAGYKSLEACVDAMNVFTKKCERQTFEYAEKHATQWKKEFLHAGGKRKRP
ncbi:MAG: hypothetical protein GY772_25395 [bacterium]|nr:hypothetical protein [bacterium]